MFNIIHFLLCTKSLGGYLTCPLEFSAYEVMVLVLRPDGSISNLLFQVHIKLLITLSNTET